MVFTAGEGIKAAFQFEIIDLYGTIKPPYLIQTFAPHSL